jgi:hypothetical protein
MVTHSDAFVRVLFTNGGAVAVLLSAPTPIACAANTVCASPLTFFLKAPPTPPSQSITVHSYLDNGGAIYLNGTPLGVAPGTPPTPLGIDGPSRGLNIVDSFITANNLSVDYDRTFHRNGN